MHANIAGVSSTLRTCSYTKSSAARTQTIFRLINFALEAGKNYCKGPPTLIEFDGQQITRKQYDKRTPGEFKLVFEVDGMVCLNSKVVHAWGEDESGPKSKTSCKRANKRRNQFRKEHFFSVFL